jgi:hypothetical protein
MRFAIQARLIQRHGDVVVRNETRLGSATALSDAVRTARTHAADGFTVWIYEVRRDGGGRPTYVSVDTLRPDVPAEDLVPVQGESRAGDPGARR